MTEYIVYSVKTAKDYWSYTNIEEKDTDEYLYIVKLDILEEVTF